MTNNSRGSKWKTLKKELKYENPWMKVYEDKVIRPDGKEGIYGYLEKPPGVFIIALDKDNSIYLIREYRYVLKQAIFQIPSGVVDERLSIEENAAKELYEETGIKAGKLTELGSYFTAPGHETTVQYAFLAENLDTSKIESHQEGDESIEEIVKVPINEVKKMIIRNEIQCGITLAALNLFFQHKKI